jgi:hypothetical protein
LFDSRLQRIVPDGLLVFFPAYSWMQACLDAWGYAAFAVEEDNRRRVREKEREDKERFNVGGDGGFGMTKSSSATLKRKFKSAEFGVSGFDDDDDDHEDGMTNSSSKNGKSLSDYAAIDSASSVKSKRVSEDQLNARRLMTASAFQQQHSTAFKGSAFVSSSTSSSSSSSSSFSTNPSASSILQVCVHSF